MFKLALLSFCLLLTTTQNYAKSVKRKGTPSPLDQSPENWTGKWFPFDRSENKESSPTKTPHKQALEAGAGQCDDGVHGIAVDFDPEDKRHSYNYLCLTGNRTLYTPNLQTEAVLEEHYIPTAFVPPVKCLNESIRYDVSLPTYGAFRPQAPKYGTYRYLPPQRWLHSLAEGAIVLLYHPCAYAGQVQLLSKTLQGCLYRYVISASTALSAQRPLALLAWGKCLQMSVVDERLVVDFIKQNAKHGPLNKFSRLQDKASYVATLQAEAHFVTDVEDSVVCGYKEMK